MLILIDLDGTLINTVHPTWKPYKDGQEDCIIDNYLAQLPVFNGAREFLSSRKAKGDNIVVVSDSHYRYVNPICRMFAENGGYPPTQNGDIRSLFMLFTLMAMQN